MTKFRIGDIVVGNEMSNRYSVTSKPKNFLGEVIKIYDEIRMDVKVLESDLLGNEGKSYTVEMDCFDLKERSKKSPSKEPKFLVIWEEDIDPKRFFDTKKEAEDFIKELVEKQEVKKDSILLIEMKSIKQVFVSKSIRTKTYKI